MALGKVSTNQIDTAATPTVAEATVTGGLTAAELGVGTTAPTGATSFKSYKNASANVVTVQNQTSDIQIQMNDGVSTGEGVIYKSGNYNLSFWTNGSSRMKIDGSGRVMMPNQPMFTVNGVAAVSTTPGNSQVLNFSGVYLNVGGHFNISQDRFVAPVTGHYFFAFSCMTTTQSHTSNIVIRKNGGGRHSSYTQNATYLRHNIAVVEQLAANDYVDIVLEHGGIHAGFDHFSGFLIG